MKPSVKAAAPTNPQDFSKKLLGRIMKPREVFTVQDEQKLVNWEFDPKKYNRIELMHITDLQFGSRAFREDRFVEYRKWILSKPQRFVLLGGDLIDAATVISPQSPYENVFEPSEQCYHLRDLLWPLQPRILGYVGGNHERRTIKTFGDSGKLIASFLNIPYSCGEQDVHIIYGKHQPFKLTLYHGRGVARTKGARINMVYETLVRNQDSQLVLVGHLHDALLTYSWKKVADKGRITFVKRAAAMSTSFIDYWNTFAEIQGLGYTDTLMVRCILTPDGHWEITLK